MMKLLAMCLSLSLMVMLLATPTPARDDKAVKADKSLSHVKGDVVSVDQNAKTLTVKKGGLRSKEITFQVEDPAVLANVHTGEEVRIGYVKQGSQMIAREIVPSTTASKK